jgi:putative hydrolase
MRLLADLHTHTLASGHAYSTATELAVAARRAGLGLIAITDHGPACPGAPERWYFWNLKVVPSIIDGVRILKGCEANPAETDNGIDLPDSILENLDFVPSDSIRRPGSISATAHAIPRRSCACSPIRTST